MTQAFTEFCCRSGGSNLNAGTRTGNSTEPGTAAFKTYTSGTWVQATRTFTPAGGANPTTDGIAVGDFVSVYPDAATVSPYVARITTVGATTFVTSSSAFSGTAPVDGALVTSASVGGAWKGPNGAEAFPFGFITGALTDTAADPPRVNFKNDVTYSITAAMTQSSSTTVAFQGYTTAYNDLGKFTIDAGTSAIVPLTISGNRGMIGDFIIQNNGTTGTNAGLVISGGRAVAFRGVVNSVRGAGISVSNTGFVTVVECETYACNAANTANSGGFVSSTGSVVYVRCISHDNTGTNNNGFVGAGVDLNCASCIADTNGKDGFQNSGNGQSNLVQCDAYNNGASATGNGITLGTFGNYIDSCNLLKNSGYGIGGGTNSSNVGLIVNCGFGSGTQANTSGTTQTTGGGVQEIGSVNYASGVTPWVDPANGDFRINLSTAINAGRGTYTQTAASYAGTIGYPDIGAAQHLESGGSSGGLLVNPGMRGGMI